MGSSSATPVASIATQSEPAPSPSIGLCIGQRADAAKREPQDAAPTKRPIAPSPVIGLRLGTRTNGEKYLRGTVAESFAVEAGTAVQLRRLRPDSAADAPTHCIVFHAPAKEIAKQAKAQAVADATWFRVDPRDVGEAMP